VSIRTGVFRSVTAANRVDYPALERSVQKWWEEHAVLQRYLHHNDHSDKQFSFLDGPITANNPMGVHLHRASKEDVSPTRGTKGTVKESWITRHPLS